MKKYFEITKRLWNLLKPFHKYFYLQLFFIITVQGLTIFNTKIVSEIIDYAIIKDWQKLSFIMIIYFALLLISRSIEYFSDKRQMENSYAEIPQYIQEFSLRTILNLNSSQYTENHSAIRQQVVDRGEDSIQGVIEKLLLQLIPLIVMFSLSLLAIGFYSKTIALVSLITLIISIIATVKFTDFWRPKAKENTDMWDKYRKVRVEAFEHLKLIKIFGVESQYIKKYLNERLSIVKHTLYVYNLNLNFGNIRMIFTIVSRAICLVLAVYYYAQGNFTVGSVYAIFSWINNMYSQLGSVNYLLRQIPLDFIYMEKYLDVLDMKAEFKEEGENKFKHGDIEFKNITFKYPKGEKDVLHDLSFKIKEGSKVAFVGYSGSGKTTITQLLLRAYDHNNGEIRIADVNIKEMSANSLRENVGYVEQQVDLFDDTIKNNILFGIKDINKIKLNFENIKHTRSRHVNKNEKVNEDTSISKISEKEIENVLEEIAKKARIDQFYHRLGEKKFETMIGERGIKLSGGERQRIGIARALIKNPNILIFDEATSALDAENEKYIKEAIDEASVGRTTIIIAHRLSTVRDVDEIFMMSNGKILAKGTHQELLKTCKEYKDLVEAQMQ